MTELAGDEYASVEVFGDGNTSVTGLAEDGHTSVTELAGEEHPVLLVLSLPQLLTFRSSLER